MSQGCLSLVERKEVIDKNIVAIHSAALQFVERASLAASQQKEKPVALCSSG
jgi:hypothetical protein